MAAITEFDLIKSPLTGKTLIEASAGTGKTFTITRLFLRLLLEMGLEIDQILVVTFTEAATNELKDRIRSLLHQAKEDFCRGHSSDDLLRRYLRIYRDHEKACNSLGRAIRDFDRAAIFTIHGFCNKVLQEHAFESDSLFETELVSEQTDLLRQIVEDFWRKRVTSQSALFLSYALDKISLKSLTELIANKVGLLYLNIIPAVAPTDPLPEEQQFSEAFRELVAEWRGRRESVMKILLESRSLNRGVYRKPQMAGLGAAMDAFTAASKANPALFKNFEKFTSSSITDGTKKGCEIPRHTFFEICDRTFQIQRRLEQKYNAKIISLKRDLFEYAKKELQKRKQEKNVYFFDDLLLNLRAALDDSAKDMVGAVRKKYKAALIDEFQDTDPVQYEIFHKIFGDTGCPLFLIGDPKQAIYGFRGADIFAYIRAKKETPTHYTLLKNYRSDANLVRAVNTLFANAVNPFVFEEIPYHESTTPDNRDLPKLDAEDGSAFRIWFVDSTKHMDNKQPLNKRRAREVIIEAVAGEIARLLALGKGNSMSFDGRAVEERDLAVLVRTNLEARLVQKALTDVGLNSVLYSSANLFDSTEAAEMERILAAVIEPRKERLLRAALASEILGVRGETLYGFTHDDSGLEHWYGKFLDYHDLWQKHGFVRMVKEFTTNEQVQQRLMLYPDGERKITNFLHLTEVLNHAAHEQRLGMTGLLKWLSEQRANTMAPIEEHQLRLESDEKAVKLVTMHMSKGLEYPIVFCPFTWSGSTLWRRNNELTFHADSDDKTLTLDLGSDDYDQHKILAEKEELAENLRLLYVAVTRAKHRCFLVWGRFKEGPSSALAYLFHQPGLLAISDVVTTLRNYVKEFDDERLRRDLNKLVEKAGAVIQVEEMPAPSARVLPKSPGQEEVLTCRKFRAVIDTSERIASYSALVTRQPHAAELADYDAVGKVATKLPSQPKGEGSVEATPHFRAFPAGAKTGNFLHGLFQNLDYNDIPSQRLDERITARLAHFGFEDAWLPAVNDMLQRVVTTPLECNGEAFTLSQISLEDRLDEMQFYFPLNRVTSKTLKQSFEHLAPEFGDFNHQLEKLAFAPLKGFMKGFIDSVFRFHDRFYLIDWKSNYLGPHTEDYAHSALLEAMAENLYVLQYHIYVLALHQYLSNRMPTYDYEKHFGGVFYLFVRGIEPSRKGEFGVFRDRPKKRMIEELAVSLIEPDARSTVDGEA